MKRLFCCATVLVALCCQNIYGQNCSMCKQTRVYRPYSYYENCGAANACRGTCGSCSGSSCSVGEFNHDVAEFKTTELHKTEVLEEYKPESDDLLYAKCVKCGHKLGFRVKESDKHSCPNCHAWYRYFDEKLWYEVRTEKEITKVPVANAIQTQVFEEINNMRTRYGLSPCVYDESFEFGAQNHSANMAKRHSCDHNDPLNGCAEICASWQTSPVAAVTAWLRSRGHAAIMLSSRYTRCAVGVATDNYGRKYWTARFK